MEALFPAVAGLLALAFGVYLVRYARRTSSWTQTRGTIVGIEDQERAVDLVSDHREVGGMNIGRTRTTSHLRVQFRDQRGMDHEFVNWATPAAASASSQPGREVVLRYDPLDPEQVELGGGRTGALVFGVCVLVIGAALLIAAVQMLAG